MPLWHPESGLPCLLGRKSGAASSHWGVECWRPLRVSGQELHGIRPFLRKTGNSDMMCPGVQFPAPVPRKRSVADFQSNLTAAIEDYEHGPEGQTLTPPAVFPENPPSPASPPPGSTRTHDGPRSRSAPPDPPASPARTRSTDPCTDGDRSPHRPLCHDLAQSKTKVIAHPQKTEPASCHVSPSTLHFN